MVQDGQQGENQYGGIMNNRLSPFQRHTLATFIFLLLGLLLVTCGGGGSSGDSGGGPTDAGPPTVSSTSPSTGAAGVGIKAAVSVIFSEPMNTATITSSTLTVRTGSTVVPGTVNCSGNTATFTPTSDWAYSTSYTVTVTPGVKDLAGNPLAGNYEWSFTTSSLSSNGMILFQENFEDANFADRGWYDLSGGTLSSSEHIPSSAKSLECSFLQGGQICSSGNPKRHKFPESDSVYVSYWVKYSSNYTGSNHPYHPHEFYIMTNLSGDWDGPAYTHLTAYIEQNEGTPRLAIQDGQNVDTIQIGQNLVNVTENRAIAGCNGDSDGYGNGDCYPVGVGEYWNGKSYNADKIYFSDFPGQYYKSDWHHVEAYFKLNSISGGKGNADGIIQYWFDGQLIVDHNNTMMRTAQYPNIKFNQFLIAPYIGDGSPVDQTFWIDDLTVATFKPPISSGVSFNPIPSIK